MWYYEHCFQPDQRNGTLVPRSSLTDFYKLPDSGYCSLYGFDSAARFAIKAQGNSQGLGRFMVYSDRLWIDIDSPSNSPEDIEATKVYTRQLTQRFIAEDFAFSVWFSGSKGFHICIRITPMQDRNVPYSQGLYVRDTLKLTCDYSLYQHARLLSNPGRVHPKTGKKKEKVFEHLGKNIITIPIVEQPKNANVDLDSLTDRDQARIALSRLGSLIFDAPQPGMRHTLYWSVASQCLEAGLKSDQVIGLLSWVNKMSPTPKDVSEVERAVKQAAQQLGVE